MSGLNITEAAFNATLNGCESDIFQVTAGELEFSVACVPLTATNASQYECPHYDNIIVTEHSDCEYLFETTKNFNESYYCALACELRPTLAARGLPIEEFVTTAAASNLQTSSFDIIFAALFVLVLLFFKPNH